MAYNVYQGDKLIAERVMDKEFLVEGLEPETEYDFSVTSIIRGVESEKTTIKVKTLEKQPVKDGLVLWYDFKDGTNEDTDRSIATDLSGNGNDGELINFAYTEGSGYSGGGLTFDGVDDHINMTVPQGQQFTIQITAKALKNGYLYSGRPNTYMRLVAGRAHINLWLEGGISSSFYSALDAFDMGEYVVVTVAVKYDEAVFFVNGIESNRQSIDSPSWSNTRLDKLGAHSTTFFEGSINSFMTYNRALTEQEISYNYQIEKERWNL